MLTSNVAARRQSMCVLTKPGALGGLARLEHEPLSHAVHEAERAPGDA